MDISKLNITELKALAFDISETLRINQSNYSLVRKTLEEKLNKEKTDVYQPKDTVQS
jgi:hypothetical protein